MLVLSTFPPAGIAVVEVESPPVGEIREGAVLPGQVEGSRDRGLDVHAVPTSAGVTSQVLSPLVRMMARSARRRGSR